MSNYPQLSYCIVRTLFRTAIARRFLAALLPMPSLASSSARSFSHHSAQLLRVAVADVMILLLFHLDSMGSLECEGYWIAQSTWGILLFLFHTLGSPCSSFCTCSLCRGPVVLPASLVEIDWSYHCLSVSSSLFEPRTFSSLAGASCFYTYTHALYGYFAVITLVLLQNFAGK